LHVSRRASAQSARNFNSRTRFTAFRQRDGVSASLVSERLPGCALSAVQRCARGTLSGLLPELRVADANASNELHQFQRELVSDELVVWKIVVGWRWSFPVSVDAVMPRW
jgi:uncharacterized protein (DUF849 family)